MYSISSVNEGKYRVLSNTLTKAFVQSATHDDPMQIGDEVRSIVPSEGAYASSGTESPEVLPESDNVPLEGPGDGQLASIDEVSAALREALSVFMDQKLVSVTQTDRGIEVEMKSKMLFESGSARLSPAAFKLLRDVAAIVRPLPNDIHVEGHTDNVPINTLSFPSNWELSAARAASVVHLFTKLGVDSTRMAAIGYGEFRPIADNYDEAGRQANRRVSLVIMAAMRERVRGRIGKAREANGE